MNEINYYAVPDPGEPSRMTYWRFTGGALRPWPTNARYGPNLHPDDVPPELLGAERAKWIHEWLRQSAAEWRTAIGFEIWRDPHGCRARFSLHTGRCGLCGARLADPASRIYGIDPACRRGMQAVTLLVLASQTLAAFAERETEPCAAR